MTASLDRESDEATSITVSVTPGTGALASDYTLSENTTLTIAAGATTSTGVVTLTAVNNAVDAPDKTVTVAGAATNTQGVTGPADLTLTITDDEDAPTVTLALSSSSISENGGSTTVTASLDRESGEATSITVSATPGTGALASDYTLSENTTLTIAAGGDNEHGHGDAHGGQQCCGCAG